jgi:hypothetical protein
MSFRKTGMVAGLALLLGGIVSANAAVVNPDLGRSPRVTSSYYDYSAVPNTVSHEQTGSIGAASADPAGNAANPFAHCLGQSPRQVSSFSCQQ